MVYSSFIAYAIGALPGMLQTAVVHDPYIASEKKSRLGFCQLNVSIALVTCFNTYISRCGNSCVDSNDNRQLLFPCACARGNGAIRI